MTGKLCFQLKTTDDNDILLLVLAFQNVNDRFLLLDSTNVYYILTYPGHCGDKYHGHNGEKKQTQFLFSGNLQWGGRNGE